MLIYGDSKQGKSWLGATTPGPRLVCDTEGRGGLLPGTKVAWDPRQPLPATHDDGSPITTDTTVYVNVPDVPTFKLVYQWLASGQHYFRSVIIDSLMELQQRVIDANVGSAQLRTQDWGDVLREVEKIVRDYRDLRQHPTNPISCLVMTAGEHEKQGKIRPLLQGSISNKLSYHFDCVGRLHHMPDGVGNILRVLSIDNAGGGGLYVAGSNWDQLTVHYAPGHILVPGKGEGRRLIEEMHLIVQSDAVL